MQTLHRGDNRSTVPIPGEEFDLAELRRLDPDRWTTAVHEAGHGLVATLLGGRVTAVSIDPADGRRGFVNAYLTLGTGLQAARSNAVVDVAGEEAERLLGLAAEFPDDSPDRQRATERARSIVGWLAPTADVTAEVLVARQMARQMLTEHRDALETWAAALCQLDFFARRAREVYEAGEITSANLTNTVAADCRAITPQVSDR